MQIHFGGQWRPEIPVKYSNNSVANDWYCRKSFSLVSLYLLFISQSSKLINNEAYLAQTNSLASLS